jgi:hypothetical protein
VLYKRRKGGDISRKRRRQIPEDTSAAADAEPSFLKLENFKTCNKLKDVYSIHQNDKSG